MNILIGNIISLVAAVFTILSCVSKDMKRVFTFQVFECAILAIASCFFGVISSVITLGLCSLRNLLTVYGKFSRVYLFFFLTAILILGISANNSGVVGLLPVFATTEYTICCAVLKEIKATKISILVNLILWIIYALLVLDFVTAISHTIIALVDIVAIIRLPRK